MKASRFGWLAVLALAGLSPLAHAQAPAADPMILPVGGMVLQAAFVQDGQGLVTYGGDGKLRVFDTDKGTQRGETAFGRPSNTYSFQFLEFPDAKRALVAGSLNKAYIVNLEDAKVLKEFAVSTDNDPSTFALVDQGATLVRLDRSLTFAHYDVETGKPKEGAQVPKPPANANLPTSARLALAPDGKTYAVNTGECTLRDAATHESRYTLKADGQRQHHYRNGPYRPIYSADSKLVALHGTDGTLRVVDVDGGKELRTLRFEETEPSRPGVVRVIAPVAFAPNGKWLLTTTEGMFGELILFGVASGLEIRRFPAKVVGPTFSNFAISSKANLLVIPGSTFDKIEIWDMDKAQIKLKSAPEK